MQRDQLVKMVRRVPLDPLVPKENLVKMESLVPRVPWDPWAQKVTRDPLVRQVLPDQQVP